MRQSPRLDLASINQPLSLDDSHNEASQIVLPVRVETRYLRCLATQQRAPVFLAGLCQPLNHSRRHIGRKPAGRQIIEKEKRFGTLRQDVVHAVVHEIDAHRVMLAGEKGHAELRAHPIRARDQNRITILRHVEPEQPSKGSDLRQDTPRESTLGQVSDPAHHFVTRIDVDALRSCSPSPGSRLSGSGH